MPIINKGIFDTDTVFTRQTGNDWPTAQVISTADVTEASSNLYFTNTRVLSALVTANVFVGNLIVASTGSIGVGTNTPDSELSILATPQTVLYPVTGASATAGTDLHIGGADANNTRITQDAFGTNVYVAFTGRTARGTAASPTAIQSGDVLTQFTARGFGASSFGTNSTGRIDIVAAENFTESSRGTSVQVFTTPIGANTPTSVATFSNAVGLNVIGDVRATANLVANGLIIRNINVSDAILTGNIVSTSTTTSNLIVADSITSNIWNRLYTSNVIETNSALYYTNTRARSAFTAGRGIIITDDGIVKSTIGSELFNPAINYAKDYNVTSTMSAALTLPSTPVNDRYILRSLHVTNISDSVAFISANVLFASGNTAYLGSLIPVPIGSVVEFMDRPQLLQPNDKVNLQGFNASQVATSGVLSSYFTYESISSDVTYVGTGQTLALSNTTIQVVHADQSDTVIESLKVVNLKTYSVPVKVFFAYSNATPKAYMAYNMQVPPNASIELLQKPKLLLQNDKIYASYMNASDGDAISIFPSYRQGSVTNLGNATPSASSGGNIDISFYTTLTDGTTLYYTLE